jgi:hypothetical protein
MIANGKPRIHKQSAYLLRYCSDFYRVVPIYIKKRGNYDYRDIVYLFVLLTFQTKIDPLQ